MGGGGRGGTDPVFPAYVLFKFQCTNELAAVFFKSDSQWQK